MKNIWNYGIEGDNINEISDSEAGFESLFTYERP